MSFKINIFQDDGLSILIEKNSKYLFVRNILDTILRIQDKFITKLLYYYK